MYNLVISILLFIIFCLVYYIYKLNKQLKEQYSVDTNNVFNLAYKIKEYLYSNPKVTTRMLADKIIEFRSYLFFPDPSDIELPLKKKD